MQKLQFKRIGFLIGLTLLLSIGVQAWRMYSQFRIIQRQLVMDIQQSLENAVESYFAELAKTDVIALTDFSGNNSNFRVDSFPGKNRITQIKVNHLDSVGGFLDRVGQSKRIFETLEKAEKRGFDSIFWNELATDTSSGLILLDSSRRRAVDQKNELRIFFGKDQADSINQLQTLTSKIIISITRDSLDFDKIKGFLQAELDRRKIDINYQLIQVNRRIPRLGDPNPPQENPGVEKPDMPFMTISRSTFLPPGQVLELYFENISLTILKRGIFEILTSLLFLGIIAYAFYYLYQTIKNQKEIAEIKQDLIANITHEFKTPIATTLSAIEGIQQFNPENDPSKTDRYLGISKNQMFKLNQMVEKLLETATLDSDQLVLKKETIEPEILLRQLVQKFQTLAPEKTIDLILPAHCKTIFADPFHFENALSNLIDNAIKYGGNEIRICLDQKGMNKVRIHDNGGNISSEQKARVFEQFYRIPKGDLHDVKGFGIGLYYVKKILEKHEGKIELETGQNSTTFITYWP
jgi:signal transduction histidine kinase